MNNGVVFFSYIALQCLKSVVIASIFIYFIKIVLFRLFEIFSRSSNLFIVSILIAIKKPVIYFTWLIIFAKYSDLIIIHYYPEILRWIAPFNKTIVCIFILYFLMNCISQLKKQYILQEKKNNIKFDINKFDTVEKVSKTIFFFIWFFVVISHFGIDLNTLLTFGGVGGIIFGLASKDLFSNIFGGMILYLDKPFSIGDFIIIEEKKIQGRVKEIGWRQTKIISDITGIPYFVPNSIFANTVIQNRSESDLLRICENIKIKYSEYDRVPPITFEIIEMLKNHINISKKISPSAFLFSVNNNLFIKIKALTTTNSNIRFELIRQDVLLNIIKIVEKYNVEIIYW